MCTNVVQERRYRNGTCMRVVLVEPLLPGGFQDRVAPPEGLHNTERGRSLRHSARVGSTNGWNHNRACLEQSRSQTVPTAFCARIYSRPCWACAFGLPGRIVNPPLSLRVPALSLFH